MTKRQTKSDSANAPILTKTAKKTLFYTAAAAFGGYLLQGTLMSAFYGAATYVGTRLSYLKAKEDNISGPLVTLLLTAIPFIWTHIFFDIPDQINRVTAPIEHTKNRLLQDAGEKLYSLPIDTIVTCESVHKFAPFGKRGTKIGDECLRLTVEKRDGQNFTAIANFTSEVQPKRLAFTKESWIFRSSGYRHAITLGNDLKP